jgi:general secretion pathway protein D
VTSKKTHTTDKNSATQFSKNKKLNLRFLNVFLGLSLTLASPSQAQFDPEKFRPETEEKPIPTSPSGIPFSEANPEDINDKNYPDKIENFDYPDVDLRDLVDVMSELTGKNFIVDPSVKSKRITIIARSPITVAQAYKAFLSALAVNGITVVKSGAFLKIINSKDALKDSLEIYSGAYYPTSDQLITKIIKLKYISAVELEKSLRSLYSRDGDLKTYEPTNSLIISDYGSNVDRIVKIANQLDVPGFEEKMEVIPILYAAAKDIADLINDVINKGENSTNSRFGAVPRFRRADGSEGGASRESLSFVTADTRTNSLIVLGNESGIQKARGLVKQLDFKVSADAQGGVYVYYVKHADAEEVQKTLSGLADESKKANQDSNKAAGSTSSGITLPETAKKVSVAAAFGDDVVIRADKNTNSLIITANKSDYEKILNILGKIDIPRDQVFVETVIMEIDVNKTREVGLSIFNLVPGPVTPNGTRDIVARQGFIGTENALTQMFNPLDNPTGGGLFTFGGGEKFRTTINNQQLTVTSLIGLLKLIEQNSIGHVLSTPKITAMDNEKSIIEVGDEVSIQTGAAVAQGGVSQNTFATKNVTIKLEITPSINPGTEKVRLKLIQNINQLGARVINNNPVISTKNIDTNIVVNSGDTAVLGGLINDRETVTTRKVPLLGDIPILGWLFRSRAVSKEKRNLIVFLTPRIIRTNETMNKITQSEIDKRLQFIKKDGQGIDPYGAKIDEISRIPDPIKSEDNWDSDIEQDQEFRKPVEGDDEFSQDLEDFLSESPGKESL